MSDYLYVNIVMCDYLCLFLTKCVKLCKMCKYILMI